MSNRREGIFQLTKLTGEGGIGISIQAAIWGIQDLLTHQTHWGRRDQDWRGLGGMGEQQERRNLSTHQTHWGRRDQDWGNSMREGSFQLTKLTGEEGSELEGEWGNNRSEGIFQLTKLTGDGHID